jgi:predicted transcriptional regulator
MDEEISASEVDTQVLAALQKAGGTLDHIAKTTRVPKRLVDESLKRLVNAGRAERKWVLVARGAHDWKFYAADKPAGE